MTTISVPEKTGINVTINGSVFNTSKTGTELRDYILGLARDIGWKKIKVFDSHNVELSIDEIADGDFEGDLFVQQHNVAA